MKKTKTTKGYIDIVPQRKTHTAPTVESSFIDDDGTVWYILENGNHIEELVYRKHWHTEKGKVLAKEPKLSLDDKAIFNMTTKFK